MTSAVDVCNVALTEIGNRVAISDFNDGTPAANAAAILYTPKMQLLARAAPWDSNRAQITLTVLKERYTDGAVSADPPPQPWNFQYAWPSDCLRARFLIPTATEQTAGTPLTTAPNVAMVYGSPVTTVPFVVGTANDSAGNPIKVIFSQLPAAQLIYTKDLSQYPDLWDSLFYGAATATLGAYFINALSRNAEQMAQQIAIAKSAIEQARAVAASESITSIDHVPDWLQARMQSAIPWAWNTTGPNGVSNNVCWDTMAFPGGLFF